MPKWVRNGAFLCQNGQNWCISGQKLVKIEGFLANLVKIEVFWQNPGIRTPVDGCPVPSTGSSKGCVSFARCPWWVHRCRAWHRVWHVSVLSVPSGTRNVLTRLESVLWQMRSLYTPGGSRNRVKNTIFRVSQPLLWAKYPGQIPYF